MRLKGADAVEMEEEWKVSREPQTGEDGSGTHLLHTASQIQKGHGGPCHLGARQISQRGK